MTEDTDPIAEGLRRAIEAADAANDAAEDVARLGKAQKDFVEKVSLAQKRSSALATGATVGAVLSLALAGLVYFRSVADLHDAAELQTEAAKLIAEEVLALKEARSEGEGDAEKEDPVAKAMEALPETVAEAVAARLAEAEAAAAEAGTESAAAPVSGDTVAAVEAARDEVLAALAEIDLGAAGTPAAAPLADAAAAPTATPDAAPVAASTGDLTDIRAALARIEAGLLRLSSAPATPAVSAPASAAPAPAAKPADKPASRPRSQNPAPAAEANPFAYP